MRNANARRLLKLLARSLAKDQGDKVESKQMLARTIRVHHFITHLSPSMHSTVQRLFPSPFFITHRPSSQLS